MSDWISVKERLPKHNERVVLVDQGVQVHGRLVYTSFHDDYAVVLHSVTHWQPLPEPPEAEEE